VRSNLGKILTSALIGLVGLLSAKPILEMAAPAAKAQVDGPSAATLRSVIVLDASASIGQKVEWTVSAGVPYVADGRLLALYTGDKPAMIAVHLKASSATGGKLTESEADHPIAVGGQPPPPGPTPPNPGPTPPNPGPGPDPGFHDLTKITYEAVSTLVAPSNTRRAEAAAFAKALHAVAKECSATGQCRTWTEAAAAVARSKAALGDARPKWEAALNKVQAAVGALFTTSTSIEDIGKAIDAVANGLDLVQ